MFCKNTRKFKLERSFKVPPPPKIVKFDPHKPHLLKEIQVNSFYPHPIPPPQNKKSGKNPEICTPIF